MRRDFLASALLLLFACAPSAGDSEGVPKAGHGSTLPDGEFLRSVYRPGDEAPIPRVDERAAVDGVLRTVLRAQRTSLPGGFTWAWEGTVPGPTLRLRRGDRLEVELINDTDAPTSIHWHGVGAPFPMDGGLTAVEPGERFVYAFEARRAGTFWYHPHFDTDGQVDGGLYGAVVVEGDELDALDDRVWLLDLPGESGHHGRGGHGGMSPRPGATQQALDRVWWINGASSRREQARPGEWIRARIVNVSNAGYLWLEGDDRMRWVAGGQGLLGEAQPVRRVLVAPGARVELVWQATGTENVLWSRPWVAMGGQSWGDPVPLVELHATGPPVDSDLPPLPVRPGGSDPGTPDEVIVFGGSDRTGRWTMDGEEWPNVPPWTWPLGARPVVEIRNVSPSDHPFHVHGQVFEVLDVDGASPGFAWVDDTIAVPAWGSVTLRLRLDALGRWMAHCHILPHAEAGMMGVIDVVATTDD